MKLKTSNEDISLYCGASRCYSAPHIIDASNKRWDKVVALCYRHWKMVCDKEEELFLKKRDGT